MTARLVVCTTCRFSSEEPVDAAGMPGGQRLLAAVTAAVEAAGAEDLRVEEQACLWACSSHCSIYLSQPGKPAYLAGRFAPTAQDAQAIVAFVRLYADSPQGAVAYHDWPEGMKGHFIARLPAPADF
jgi:predicted metal-binding protein